MAKPTIQSVDGKVRFVCPNGGVAIDTWYHIHGDEWKRRVEWGTEVGRIQRVWIVW